MAALPDLRIALENANKVLSSKGTRYTVAATNQEIDPKKPIYLQLRYADGTTRMIGITHLVHLRGSDWDSKPFEAIARTTEEVAQAILARIDRFFDAQGKGLHIDENGTIFDFGKVGVKLHEDKTFSIDGILVTWQGKPLALNIIKSESTVTFKRLDNGDIELVDDIDRREEKGIFINKQGEIYRG